MKTTKNTSSCRIWPQIYFTLGQRQITCLIVLPLQLSIERRYMKKAPLSTKHFSFAFQKEVVSCVREYSCQEKSRRQTISCSYKQSLATKRKAVNCYAVSVFDRGQQPHFASQNSFVNRNASNVTKSYRDVHRNYIQCLLN